MAKFTPPLPPILTGAILSINKLTLVWLLLFVTTLLESNVKVLTLTPVLIGLIVFAFIVPKKLIVLNELPIFIMAFVI